MEFVEPNSPRWLSLNNLPNERWKDIAGYEGLYQISDYGRVKSLARKTNNQYGIERIMRLGNNGYYSTVGLCKNGKHKTFCIHNLVAKAFIPNPGNKPCVLHIKAISDGGSNHYTNLYWGTPKENMMDRKRDGRFNCSDETRAKISNSLSKPVCQYTKLGEFVKMYKSAKEAEMKTGIKNNHIGTCCKGKRKSTGGYAWAYYKEGTNGMEIFRR